MVVGLKVVPKLSKRAMNHLLDNEVSALHSPLIYILQKMVTPTNMKINTIVTYLDIGQHN